MYEHRSLWQGEADEGVAPLPLEASECGAVEAVRVLRRAVRDGVVGVRGVGLDFSGGLARVGSYTPHEGGPYQPSARVSPVLPRDDA
jgi:hypothetical protein